MRLSPSSSSSLFPLRFFIVRVCVCVCVFQARARRAKNGISFEEKIKQRRHTPPQNPKDFFGFLNACMST